MCTRIISCSEVVCPDVSDWPHTTWQPRLQVPELLPPMDLLSVLPGFATKPYAHLLPSLERSKLTTVDLITLDTLEIAKRAHVPPADVRRLCVRVVEALHADLGFQKTQTNIDSAEEKEPSSSINADAAVTLGPSINLQPSRWEMISTLDPTMDALLGGGIPTGYLTEVTGERSVVMKLFNAMFLTNSLLSVVAAARLNSSLASSSPFS